MNYLKSMTRIQAIVIIMLSLAQGVYSQSRVYDVILRSSALRGSGRASEAILLIDEALIDGVDYRLLLERGEAFLMMNNLEEAYSSFSHASAVRAHSGSFGLARVYAAKGDVRNSLDQLEHNLNSTFREGERKYFADPWLHMIDNSVEWRSFWEKERYTEGERILEEVRYLTAIGRSAEAAIITGEASNEQIQGAEIGFADALVRFEMGDYSGAVAILTGKSSVNMPAENRDRLLARCLNATGEYRKALSLLLNLISSEMPDATLFLERAEAYRGLSDFNRALRDIDYYLSIYPDDPVAIGSAGTVSMESGNNSMALVYLNRLVEVDPNNREAYISRGDMWGASGMWKNAASDYSMALDLDPFDGNLYCSKGIALLNQGMTEQACHDFRAALKLGNKKASEYYNRHCIK
jgi:tetratricopeptide (TPR) repeat protein